MIEVFKTNITCPEKANQLIELMHQCFVDYKANFDLHDCDKILRVVSSSGTIASQQLIGWLNNLECTAEILPDN